MLSEESENVLTRVPLSSSTPPLALVAGAQQRITSQPEVISSPEKHQNVLLDALYKTICSANKVKMF
jgi:hypothetical protein